MNDEKDRQRLPSHGASPTVSAERNEFDFIADIRRRANTSDRTAEDHSASTPNRYGPSVLCGIGDDAAVLRQVTGRETVITTDLLVEEIDFYRVSTPARALGHKALAISLSDIASMGARPRWALMSIGIPEDVWRSDFVDQMYEGFFALADRYDVRLIGGDTSRTPEKILVASVLLGESCSDHSIFRRGARPGDRLFVTGSLGGSGAGLRLLQRGARLEKFNDQTDGVSSIKRLLHRHLLPEPRVGWGLVLGEERLANAMIDLSDGLSSDLHHLCRESNVGAVIQSSGIPVDPSVAAVCGRRALDPLILALDGGEDFELMFAVSPENVRKLPAKVDGVSITQIGEIRPAAEGIRVLEGSHLWNLQPGGWNHFLSSHSVERQVALEHTPDTT